MNPRLLVPTPSARIRLLAVALVISAIGLPPAGLAAQADPIGATLERARVRPDESRWQAIPWHTSLTEALAIAQREQRPVFLFGYDGIADTGLC